MTYSWLEGGGRRRHRWSRSKLYEAVKPVKCFISTKFGDLMSFVQDLLHYFDSRVKQLRVKSVAYVEGTLYALRLYRAATQI